MASEPRTLTREERGALRQNTVINILVVGIIIGTLYLIWPFLWTQIQIRAGLIAAPTEQALPTAIVAAPRVVAPPVPTIAPVVLNDPALNGGNSAPPGCQFPIAQGACANGGAPNEDVAPAEMAKPAVEAAPAMLPPVATVLPGAVANPALGQCLHGQVFTSAGCKNSTHEKAKP